MALVFDDYSRDRIGWFFGLNGWQLAVLVLSSLPVFLAVRAEVWSTVLLCALGWLLVLLVTVVPVRGRPATGWLTASLLLSLGRVAGWTRFRAHAAHGAAEDLAAVDLPGVLQGIDVHDGPPRGASLSRVAVIQDHAARTWAVTAAVVHPGLGFADATERAQQAAGLTSLLDLAAHTELIDELLITVRTVPDDGAERDLWMHGHRRPEGPPLARAVNDDLRHALTAASVRTEAWLTLVVPETRMGRVAKQSGGGLDGRARVLYGLMGEVEAQLRGAMAMTEVTWLSSPDLALACRTGFAPGDRAGIVAARAERDHPTPGSGWDASPASKGQAQDDAGAAPAAAPVVEGVVADVPWAMAGPSGADAAVRHYTHDAWASVSATIKLPDNGAVMGALAPVLTPSEPGERRSFTVVYPILRQATADRQSATREWSADLGEELKNRAGMKIRARARSDAARARGLDSKLARGHCMTRPYAVATVTVPSSYRVEEFGCRLDAAIRRAGYAPLRLDLAQDLGFAATAVPLGVSLTRRGDA
ncbi:SCO6880 family protein [Aquipuribacter sp. MA13-6]|uniref:SCO6880 family protein n=1 Tax=unclassified Aquipuribacter TaxID=2635084 RepID=UPI003EEB9117